MFSPLPEVVRRSYIAQMNKTKYTLTVSKEMAALSESLDQLKYSKVHLLNKPLAVISAGKFSSENEREVWNRLQKHLLSKSNRSKQIIA